MSDEVSQQTFPPGLSRRAFVGGAAMTVGAAAVSAGVPAIVGERARLAAPARIDAAPIAPAPPHRNPVVGFYMDRPYLDPTGAAEPYVPPVGTRSGQAHAQLSASEFLSRHPYG